MGITKMEIMNYPMPKPTGNQVLIKTKYAGICHSELHLIEGYFDMGGGKKNLMRKATRSAPYTLGHEIEGHIVDAGENVPLGEFDMSKSYAIFPWIGSDLLEECVQCSIGNSNLCPSPKTQRYIDGRPFGRSDVMPLTRIPLQANGNRREHGGKSTAGQR